jgi:hypothetical protein
VDASQAANIQSDRFLNASNMVCPVWNKLNTKGQYVCENSFVTKTAGCNSALDRVQIENSVTRPEYSAFLNLNVGGIEGDFYNSGSVNSDEAREHERSRRNNGASFGNQFYSSNKGSCSLNAYEKGMAQISSANRQESFALNSYQQNQYQQQSGSCGY